MGPKYRDAAKSELDAQRELLDSLMGIMIKSIKI